MWSRSQPRGVDGAAGEHAVPVTQQDGFAHDVGWVVPVDRGDPGRVEDGADGDPVGAAQPVGQQLQRAGPEPLHGPTLVGLTASG